MTKPSLTITRVIKAPAKRVFEAWTSADQLKAWHCPTGMTVNHAECNPTVGGRYAVNMVASDGSEHRAAGNYVEISPFTKLAFTWAWETGGDPANGSHVTITLKDLGPEVTELTLLHERLENMASRDGHIDGWTGALNNLEAHLT